MLWTNQKAVFVVLLFSALLGLALPSSTALTNIMVPLCGLLGLYWARGQVVDFFRTNPFALLPLLLWLALAFGAVFSPAPEAWAYFAKYKKLLFIPLLALFFLKGPEKTIQFAIGGFLLGNLGILLLSTLVWSTGQQVWFGTALRAASAISKNAIAQTFLMAFAGIVWLAIAIRYRQWAAYLLAVACFAGVYLMSPQRTGHLAGGLLLLSFGWMYLQNRWRYWFLAVMSLAVLAIALSNNPVQQRMQLGVNEVVACQTALNTPQQDQACLTSMGIRSIFYLTALKQIAEYPLLGKGTGAIKTQIGPLEMSNPHNEYLLQGMQLGLLGVALYLALLASALKMALGLPRVWAAVAVGVTASYGACSLFNSLLMDVSEGNTFTVFFALLLAASALIKSKKELRHD
ncbi:O-antigen ligase family protein [Deefgea salmonis]|uniref:O-antigen ligase family protein n=1 Tax=Deefgea salmonis TaxID=2875502 RepID=A0ABS8BMK4_9NEIS|nr:O-antigen ligase family protein [Deefgea salmonis]MCB5196837.1 O-antigen ligase family protein [Deefgea salmonis]